MPPSKRLLWSLLGQQSEGELPQKMACLLLSLPMVSAATINLSRRAIQLMGAFEGTVIIHIMRVLLVRTGSGAIDRFLKIHILGSIITMIRENQSIPATLMNTDRPGLVTLITKDQAA